MPKKKKKQVRRKKKSFDLKGLLSNLLIISLITLVMGFVWSIIDNFDSEKYSSFDQKKRPTYIDYKNRL